MIVTKLRAELPDPQKAPELFEIVTKHMIHNPCGRYGNSKSCMIDKRCTKHFPNSFCNETSNSENGYPQYKRRSVEQGGRSWQKNVKNVAYSIDNSWVVPYNPYLLLKYNSHVNVEICSTISAIKYLYKYVYKGHTRIIFDLRMENNYNNDNQEKNRCC